MFLTLLHVTQCYFITELGKSKTEGVSPFLQCSVTLNGVILKRKEEKNVEKSPDSTTQ